VLLALGKAVPERAMAAWSRHMCPVNIGMDPRHIDPRSGHIVQYYASTFASDAGSGAVKGHDGWHGIQMQVSAGNFMRPDMEHFEFRVPYLCTRYEILPDWEGAGEFRGSPGVYTEQYADTPGGAPAFLMTGNSDGEFFPGPGVQGGGRAPGAQMWIIARDGTRRTLRTMANQPIYPGERYLTMCPGGGGYGNPLDRDVLRVQNDVMDGLVSVQRAKDVYGVLIDAETFEIDHDGTKRLRAELSAKQNRA
jgi:N-methylhydantoinase B